MSQWMDELKKGLDDLDRSLGGELPPAIVHLTRLTFIQGYLAGMRDLGRSLSGGAIEKGKRH